MYTTVSIKNEWQTVFCCGNKVDPEDTILILGSCRVVPFLNYLAHYNDSVCGGKRFRIYAIDPINYCVDVDGNHLDTDALLKALETDEHFLSILRSVTIFIHEGLSSYGILNTVKVIGEKTIYSFGMKPRVDINIPNFHDVFILFNDFIETLSPELQGKPIPDDAQERIFRYGNDNIMRFLSICQKSSFPAFGEYFRKNYQRIRLFHSFNHVSAAFTLEIFSMMAPLIGLEIPLDFWKHPDVQSDLYGNKSTPVSEYDMKWRQFEFK